MVCNSLTLITTTGHASPVSALGKEQKHGSGGSIPTNNAQALFLSAACNTKSPHRGFC